MSDSNIIGENNDIWLYSMDEIVGVLFSLGFNFETQQTERIPDLIREAIIGFEKTVVVG